MWFVHLRLHKDIQNGIHERIINTMVWGRWWSGKASAKDDTWAGFGSTNGNSKGNDRKIGDREKTFMHQHIEM